MASSSSSPSTSGKMTTNSSDPSGTWSFRDANRLQAAVNSAAAKRGGVDNEAFQQQQQQQQQPTWSEFRLQAPPEQQQQRPDLNAVKPGSSTSTSKVFSKSQQLLLPVGVW